MTNKKGKAKGPKVNTITTKDGESVKVFEDMNDFETYLKNETEDNEFDNVHCKLKYYPPFVMRGTHDDPEKIKDTANCHSKKYVRHLKQHVEKHLLKDIKDSLQNPNIKFNTKTKNETFDTLTWKYEDETEINSKKFKIDVEICCHNNGALVDVDYKTGPIITTMNNEPEESII
ncbi:Respiratory growth induced protein 1 [Maudiozyma exigua]|uniref:Respiratory growth induced protein 1 n=1 Tax=Maudiozyma exigua TaxID=34358 RepID=A0A9P6WDS3_MAUEX|nr:Respiratory growth induced protein 1 [Kazachstania exigua]